MAKTRRTRKDDDPPRAGKSESAARDKARGRAPEKVREKLDAKPARKAKARAAAPTAPKKSAERSKAGKPAPPEKRTRGRAATTTEAKAAARADASPKTSTRPAASEPSHANAVAETQAAPQKAPAIADARRPATPAAVPAHAAVPVGATGVRSRDAAFGADVAATPIAAAPRSEPFAAARSSAAADAASGPSGREPSRRDGPEAGTPPPRPSVPTPSAPAGEEDEGWEPLEPQETTERAIPPIPEEADEFEPIEEDEQVASAREAPAGTSPRDVLEGVRRGRLHVSALSAFDDRTLAALAREVGLGVEPEARRTDILYRLLHERPREAEPPTYFTEGLLELLPDGYGFLRKPETGYVPVPGDAYVSPGLVRRWRLATGHWISGTARGPRPGEKTPALLEVEEVNHEDPARAAEVVPFERLTVTHPDTRYLLETEAEEPTGRLIDLFCPLGRGQRALVVSPPRAGKTIVLQRIADALARNSPEVEIVVLLVDERPEEVTNMRRSVRGEVIASTFDQPAHRHIRLVELVMEKVKRMVEYGRHVVLLVDSLTRIGRAYNNESHGTGRLLTGGLEASALTKPKRIFGAARNVEHGGSLTIVATALVDTGSRLDQVIFEEFKGTGNLELILDRDLANQRLYPAIDIPRSGTRKEELLLHPEEQRRIVALRRQISQEPPAEALLEILEKFAKYRTNAEFLMRIDAS